MSLLHLHNTGLMAVTFSNKTAIINYSTGELVACSEGFAGVSSTIIIGKELMPTSRIRNIQYDPLNQVLAVSSDNKELILLKQFQPFSTKKLIKKSTRLLFNDGKLIISDKFGDVYHLDEQGLRLLLGHVSIMTDMILVGDKLITCDRDEKIRISEYPSTYNIHTFCLGHSEFVSKLCKLSDSKFVSGGGDDYLLLWDMNGTCLQKFDLNIVILAKQNGLTFPDRKPYLMNMIYDFNTHILVISFAK